MSSPLRSFVQFAPLERKLRQVAERSPDWKIWNKRLTGPALIEYERAKAMRWEVAPPDAARLQACLELVTAPVISVDGLTEADFVEFAALLLNRAVDETDLRQGVGSRISDGHVCLDPAAVPRALARFFEWTTSQAFAEMHALEQMTLCQVRLYEIWPLELYSGLAADFFSLRVLYLKTSLLPMLTAEDTDDFQEALSEAFGFVTKPLVDFYLRACQRACDEVLRQL